MLKDGAVGRQKKRHSRFFELAGTIRDGEARCKISSVVFCIVVTFQYKNEGFINTESARK